MQIRFSFYDQLEIKRAKGVRTKNLYQPGTAKPYKLSRSKLEDFIRCPRCFYLDRRLGIGRPSIPGYTLNSAVDTLLKKEFDIHRAGKRAHPIMEAYGIDAVPFGHDDMEKWRHNFHGVQHLHRPTNFLLYGAVDDIWQNPEGELIVVDYKSTSKDGEVNLDDKYKDGFKRQMEIYQWLLRRLNFTVSNTGYFVYANASTNNQAFDAKLEFKLTLLPYQGDDGWVEQAVNEAYRCLNDNEAPPINEDCEYCHYRLASRLSGDV